VSTKALNSKCRRPLVQECASHEHRNNKTTAPEYDVHSHGDKVGKSLIIEDGEQAEKDHLNKVDGERNPSWFELGYWNPSPSGDCEVFWKSVDSND
jgi:hypothetical protein